MSSAKLVRKYADAAPQLRLLEWTAPTPGLAYIAAKGADVNAIFQAVSEAIGELSDADRSNLFIRDIVRIPESDYFAVRNL